MVGEILKHGEESKLASFDEGVTGNVVDKEFEKDLDYLLGDGIEGREEAERYFTGDIDGNELEKNGNLIYDERRQNIERRRKQRPPVRISLKEITDDITSLDFSITGTNNGGDEGATGKKKSEKREKMKKKDSKKTKEMLKNGQVGEVDGDVHHDKQIGETKNGFEKDSGALSTVDRAEENGIEMENQKKKLGESHDLSPENKEEHLSKQECGDKKTPEPKKARKSNKKKKNGVCAEDCSSKQEDSEFLESPAQHIAEENSIEETQSGLQKDDFKKKKKKPRKSKKLKDKERQVESNSMLSPGDLHIPAKEMSNLNFMGLKLSPGEPVEDLETDVKNISRESSIKDKPSSNGSQLDMSLRLPTRTKKSKYPESLASIEPIKTIIGLSHGQIMTLPLVDVKIKTIVSSSSISKFSGHVLRFAIQRSHDFFSDFETRALFFDLCIEVALNEAEGFKKCVTKHPNIPELFSQQEELTLHQTHTKHTPSNKDIHHNDLDYSVLSYVGHILIWGYHQQQLNGIPPFCDKYSISMDYSTIEKCIGGFHLWDRLKRNLRTMNLKRWKHIIKFRQNFSYEEDQFMLIIRFMNVDDTFP